MDPVGSDDPEGIDAGSHAGGGDALHRLRSVKQSHWFSAKRHVLEEAWYCKLPWEKQTVLFCATENQPGIVPSGKFWEKSCGIPEMPKNKAINSVRNRNGKGSCLFILRRFY